MNFTLIVGRDASTYSYEKPWRLNTNYLLAWGVYNGIKSPASGAGNVSKLRLKLQVGTVREVACAYIIVFL